MSGVNALIFTDCSAHTGSVWSRSIGAYRIANQLRNIGMTVQVIDFFNHIMIEDEFLMNKILNKFIGSNTMFVGFSTTFMNSGVYELYDHPSITKDKKLQGYNRSTMYGTTIFGVPIDMMLNLREKIKTINSNVDLIIAGSRIHDNEPIGDIHIVGYGESQILDYVKWKNGKNPFFTWRSVKRGEINRKIIEHDVKANNFDFTNSRHFWHKTDCIQKGEALPIEISRGCIFRCKFCSYPLNGKTKLDFLKCSDLLKQELLDNYYNFGTTRYIFSDDTYNDTTEKLQYVNEIVKDLPFKLEFGTYVRLDLIASKPEHADLMLENGIKFAFFGIESLNHKSSKLIGKGMNPDRLVETLHWLRSDKWKNDVITTAGFIIGLPHDTYSSMESWIERIIHPSFPLHTFALAPLGILNTKTVSKNNTFISEIDANPLKFGYVLDDNIVEYWDNTIYNTSFSGCNKLSSDAQLYARSTGRTCISTQAIMNTIGYGIDYSEHINRGSSDILPICSSITRFLFLSYIHDVLNLEIE